jgi:hypothetical protein
MPIVARVCGVSGNLSNLYSLSLSGTISGTIPTELYVLFVVTGRTIPVAHAFCLLEHFHLNTAHASLHFNLIDT